MPLSIDVQFDIVMYSIISGILIGIMFDLYNIIRGVKIPKIIIIIEDILFWILTAIIVFAFLLYANYAFLGPYVYIFMIVTLIIYLKIIIIIEDILFWILTAIIVFAFLLYANYAFLGPYVYIFMIVTLIIYLKLISPTILKLERYMIDKTGKFIRIFLKNLIYPIKLIYYNICGKK